MEDTLYSFENRQKAVRRKHTRMAKGYVTKLNKHGVFVQEPDHKASGYVMRKLMIALVGLLTFKSFVLYWLGSDVYQGKVDALNTGTAIDKAGAFLMQIDPLSAQIAQLFKFFTA
ncbi:hypothetical protein [Pelagimonas varians]|uniref:Uncharacterized protein n=1 Tax=Pelagimonas varians TaxID=696760 RepID=A0A238KRD9_9RHOB|nr:hypothetical protein [Pelagimonas varians]PYG28616.1 hypothetical protein C8N36_111116 [Pelagimonas varians]SMX45414.1 hypothetical protein PEV8663_03037 [Pelagimonas varians]